MNPQPKVRIIQYWSDSRESFRLSPYTHFKCEVHQFTGKDMRLTVGGLVIPMGGKIELEVIEGGEA